MQRTRILLLRNRETQRLARQSVSPSNRTCSGKLRLRDFESFADVSPLKIVLCSAKMTSVGNVITDYTTILDI